MKDCNNSTRKIYTRSRQTSTLSVTLLSEAKYSKLLAVSLNEQKIHEHRPRKSKQFP
jgi:hypothetical protein